jgi:hypothetical protein
MKEKVESLPTDDLRREYERSDFPKGFVRGKYSARLAADGNTEEREQKICALRQALIEGEKSRDVGEHIEAIKREARRRTRLRD